MILDGLAERDLGAWEGLSWNRVQQAWPDLAGRAAADWYRQRVEMVERNAPELRETLDRDTADVYAESPRELEEGLLISPSSAAALLGCFQVAARIPKQQKAVMVTVFPDSASRYLNERFWDEE